MAERTQRGDEDRKRDLEEVQGEPVSKGKAANAGTPAANTTRDKGVTPGKETSGNDDAAER